MAGDSSAEGGSGANGDWGGDRDSSGTGSDEIDVVLIAAVAANGVIGADGDLPWDIPEDMAHFKETTMDHPVIVGRNTFENVVAGLGGPLPGRTNVVLSRSDPDVPDDDSVVVADSTDAALDAAAETGADRAYVMGGATVYGAYLERADRLVLTEIEGSHDGDATFPGWPPSDAAWTEVERDQRDGFAFVTYERAE